MAREDLLPTPGWRVVRLLWTAARRRAVGRMRRQQELMGRRKEGQGLRSLSRILALAVVCFVHAALGWMAVRFAQSAGEFELERNGQIVVSASDWGTLENLAARQDDLVARKREFATLARPRFQDRQSIIGAEQARDRALMQFVFRVRPNARRGSTEARAFSDQVRRQFLTQGMAGFVRLGDSFADQLAKSTRHSSAAVPIAALVLLCWLGMMVSQGEGLELDVQRRRHPMWEWLLSHPIRPAHAFYVELLTPLMANPVYLTAPIFIWVLVGHVFGPALGLAAGVLIGLPMGFATSAINRAIETWALLRLGVRHRGALLGILSWFGYVMMLVPLLTFQVEGLGRPLGNFVTWVGSWLPAGPIRSLLLGWSDSPNLTQVILSWWALVGALSAFALWTTHRATMLGLQAPSDGSGPRTSAALTARGRFGRDPLRRKELLWITRDKSAVVQVILIPLTIAATQAFNFRGLYRLAAMNWSALCGIGIICGTYFLLVLGPRSLASEGAALWLPLTWPRGLEDLLREKARLWGRVADFVVGGVLLVTGFLFPSAWWKIMLVYAGWLVFSSTLALKSVSLVRAPSSSGESEPPDRARQWIAMIGTLTFGAGVITQTWHVAIMGIVFSSLVAVAMWQGLRARLPYLFDPWSEEPVPAPSLLHATVGVALLVEFVGIVTAVAAAAGGPSSLWLARALGYGVAGAMGCAVMQGFLNQRGVPLGQIVRWSGAHRRFGLPTGLVMGIGAGAMAAVLASGYVMVLRNIPTAREALDEAARMAANHTGQQFWIFLLTVVFAPIAEEYFFRGLLFRTLDRELGDWRALVLSAAFFAIFHPPLAWIPVAAVGMIAAWLFRATRHLLPSIACHMAYNGCLLLMGEMAR